MEWGENPKTLRIKKFFADPNFAALAFDLLYSPTVHTVSRFLVALLFAWMFFLHWAAFGAGLSKVDPEREKYLTQIKSPTLISVVGIPEIYLQPQFFKSDSLPSSLKTETDFLRFDKFLKMHDKGDYQRLHTQVSQFIKKYPQSAFVEYAYLLKADALYQIHNARADKKWGVVLEDYEDILRRFPLHVEVPRLLYQVSLIQLTLNLGQEAEDTARRAIKEYGKTDYGALYHLILGERAFQAQQDSVAADEFSFVISQFPKTRAAADAAFRKAFLAFRRGDYALTLKTYQALAEFHSDVFEILKMAKEASSFDRFIDRIYYAETLYLMKEWNDAARMYQDLANLFPTHPLAPYLYLRLADIYKERGRLDAAKNLYDFTLDKFSRSPVAKAMAMMRVADLYFATGDLKATRFNEKLYEGAYDATAAQNADIAALALAKLAAFHLYFKTYPRAQAILKQYRKLYPDSLNFEWATTQYTRTVELEILDYYRRDDYLAALATYLVFEQKQTQNFTDTKVLLHLADAAKRMSLYSKAAQILNRVVYLEKTSEGRQEAILKLIDLLIIQGDLKKAAERLRRFNFAYPLTPLAYLYEKYWGQLYAKMDKNDQAATYYEKALKATRANPAGLFNIRQIYLELAQHYQKVDQPVLAIESYEKYIKLIEENKKSLTSTIVVTSKDLFEAKISRYRVADLFFNMHDYVRALEEYRKVAVEFKEEPFLSHARYRMGECFLLLGDRASALKAFESIESKDTNNIWVRAAKSYIQTVQMEAKYGIRILN